MVSYVDMLLLIILVDGGKGCTVEWHLEAFPPHINILTSPVFWQSTQINPLLS